MKPQALTQHLWPRPQTASVCELLGPGNSEEPSLLLGDGFVTLQTEGTLRITGNLRVRSARFEAERPCLKQPNSGRQHSSSVSEHDPLLARAERVLFSWFLNETGCFYSPAGLETCTRAAQQPDAQITSQTPQASHPDNSPEPVNTANVEKTNDTELSRKIHV